LNSLGFLCHISLESCTIQALIFDTNVISAKLKDIWTCKVFPPFCNKHNLPFDTYFFIAIRLPFAIVPSLWRDRQMCRASIFRFISYIRTLHMGFHMAFTYSDLIKFQAIRRILCADKKVGEKIELSRFVVW